MTKNIPSSEKTKKSYLKIQSNSLALDQLF